MNSDLRRYTIQIKVRTGHTSTVQDQIKQLFPFSTLVDTHNDTLTFHLPASSDDEPNAKVQVSTVFGALLNLGEMMDDFSVSQTSLEQVFLKLAKEKEPS